MLRCSPDQQRFEMFEMTLPVRLAGERIADADRDVARLRDQGAELRQLAALMAEHVSHMKMHALATELETSANWLEDLVYEMRSET